MKIEYVTHSGDDLTVVNAARASFGKESVWELIADPNCDPENGEYNEIAVLSDKDKKLINFLAREKHVLPFRHPQITLRCKAPIFLARQLGKHQVGMSWSEESRRYITTEPEFYWPDKWRKKADNVKQGSSDEVCEAMYAKPGTDWTFDGTPMPVDDQVRLLVYNSLLLYNEMLELGTAPELARMILPQNMYVTWVWTGSLLSFYQLYKLRSEAHAQKEARDFAEMIKAEVSKLYPESWAALERHV